MKHTILIAGGTGLIGRELCTLLREKGWEVRILTRNPRQANEFAWDPSKGTLDERAMIGVDTVINLAGAGIADKRWTTERKQLLINSRTESAHTLREYFRRSGHLPQTYLAASAIGYYGNSGETPMYETDKPVDASFMVQCCEAWETASEMVAAMGIRTVVFRIGIVLSKEGGALPEFIKPMHMGVGAYFGDGNAWYSWVHRHDVSQMFVWAIEEKAAAGVYNAVAPNPVRNKNLIMAISKELKIWAVFVPAPTFAIRLALGEMSAVVLNSNRVSGEKIIQAGFHFKYPTLESALQAEKSS
jgi:uncharacterized protein (TIGR01777 family)